MTDIEQLISDFKKMRWDSAPFERMVEIVQDHPERVKELAERIVSDLPEGGTFLDASLSFLAESEWDSLVTIAVNFFDANRENEAAESIVAYASLQSPSSLHRHLDRLLLIPPNKSSYYASWPWRKSNNLHAEALEKVVLSSDSSDEKLAAWRRALETRHEPVLLRFLELAGRVDLDAPLRKLGIQGSVTVNNHLHLVGYEYVRAQLRRLVSEVAFHIVFPLEFVEEGCSPEFPAEALEQCFATIVKTPQRWFWQDWALSNSRENLNRIGGEPCWIQDAEYPTCPRCTTTMKFLFQLDSHLPTSDEGEWLWGSGGLCYGFWCNPCRVSAYLWQCT